MNSEKSEDLDQYLVEYVENKDIAQEKYINIRITVNEKYVANYRRRVHKINDPINRAIFATVDEYIRYKLFHSDVSD